ncbi:MAG: transporter substrate-binding domain-containing protein [Clostridiales bacterium]|jgi:polar amino acid transport system substrate-binding protein|nr:transporter substrate-binding domain-containing protein [Clostridiales bacterium]
MKKLMPFLASILVLAACGSTPSSAGKEYVIYSDNAFAPFEFLDTAANAYTGVDMDLLAAIAKDQGFSYAVKNEGFDAAMGAVQSGQADGMIAGMTITDKRKETFDFSEGYFQDGQILVVAEGSSISGLEDLNGQAAAVKTSTQGADYAQSISDQYGFTLQFYEDSPTMYTAVINGINAACFEDFSVIGWAIKNDGLALKTVGDIINPGAYGFATKKGSSPELLDMFNKGLASIKSNGQYDEILARYGY